MNAGVPQPARAIDIVSENIFSTTDLAAVGNGTAIGAVDLAYLRMVALHIGRMNPEHMHEMCITIATSFFVQPTKF